VGLDDAVSVLPQTAAKALLFPTPRASDGAKGSPNQRGSKGDLMLTSAIARLARHPDVPPGPKRKKAA
jgi:DNA (cytosine-5)-methyltransferase 1